MNCFSHAFPFLDRDPYFVVGTCVPDWLSMVARKTRAREKLAARFLDDPDPRMTELAAGIIQHHRDDHWFHEKGEFVELNLALSIQLRELLGRDAGFRPHLTAHILVEVLLDAWLHRRNPGRLDDYYQLVGQVEPVYVQQCINRIATQPTDKIVWFFPKFIDEAYLYDYVDDQRVLYRLNRVLARVKLTALSDSVSMWIADVRDQVYDFAPILLGQNDRSRPT